MMHGFRLHFILNFVCRKYVKLDNEKGLKRRSLALGMGPSIKNNNKNFAAVMI